MTLICALIFVPRGSMQTQDVRMATTAQTKEAPKFALLVGINNYTSPTIRDLNGTHNDVDIVKNLLVEQYKFKEEKVKAAPKLAPCGQQTAASPVKTLCSEQATQAAIIEAFEKHLITNAENYQKQNNVSPDKGVTVVFYYSGHGSTLPDEPGGDESDGIDETIVAADSDNYGAKDIRDDKFEELFGRLKKFTSNVTFIFDSCHSGTVTRGNGIKSVERNFKLAGGTSRGDSTNLADNMNADASYVTISGSLPNEKSQEDYFPIEKPKAGAAKDQLNGALTYYLVQNLRRNPDATYREIMNQVQTTVVNLKRGQTPQAEGAIDRVVFGSGSARQKTPIFIKSSEVVKRTFDGKETEVNEIQMDVGTIAGAQNGGVVAVYSRKARQLEGDQR
ncbi:MAG: caspase family protein [Pyrinomonadaceae bacterium]